MTSVRVWDFFGPYFLVFGHDTEIYRVILHFFHGPGKTQNLETFHLVCKVATKKMVDDLLTLLSEVELYILENKAGEKIRKEYL